HPDDVFAVATLKLLLENDQELTIIRTRDVEKISAADYVVDVGGEYDPARNRFDHHQTSGAGKRENTIPYASFGLVWKKFGEQVCGSKEIADKIEEKLVLTIDADDNGLIFSEPKIKDLYSYDIPSFFYSLNPTWKE